MAGFFPHTGGAPAGYSALPVSTFATILDDLVADIGAGQNGWTLFDDQRVGFTPLILPCNVCGLNLSGQGLVFTNGAATLGQVSYGRFRRNWITGGGTTGSFISVDQVNWYYLAAIATQVAATLDRNFTGTTTTTATGHNVYEKSGPYIVLKCTSSQKTFYVLLCRPMSYGIGLRVQVFETWNAGTHTGTNPGPQEEMRCFEDGQGRSGATKLQYLFFPLPDVLGLWLRGAPSEGGVVNADFFYCGNLTPLRVGDTTCLISACTNQDLSGISVYPNIAYNATGRVGGASMFRNIAGVTWVDPRAVASYLDDSSYSIVPRGSSYHWGIDRTNLDDSAKFQFCELDAYFAGSSGNGFTQNEGKRGELKYIKVPVMNPSGMGLASLGPADDGNTYILFRSSGSPTIPALPTTYNWDGIYNVIVGGGFCWGQRNGSLGEVYFAANNYILFNTLWMMMPINL